MTDEKITDLTALAGASVASGDQFVIVDVSDATMDAAGTDKNITASGLATAVGTLLSLASTYQPLDSDLTAIAALSTTSFGRAFLALADAAAARTAIGAVIGTDVEAHDADLTTIAGLTPTNDDVLQRKAGAWTNRTIAQLATDLGLAAGYQPLDSDLTAIAALATTSYGRSLLTLADATALAGQIPSSTITNAQLATEAQATIKGRAAAAGTGAVTDLTATQVRTIIDSNTTPSTQAVGDSAAVGTADTLARGDHKHAMPAFATNTVALGSSAAAGAATTLIRSDATIAAFDATSPSTQAVGDSAVVGTAAFAARRDHKHAMPDASALLTAIKTVDGSGSGLDADLLDGISSAAFLQLTAGGASVENIGAVESNVNTVATTGATETLDTSVYAVHDCTMDQSCTFTFSNPAPSGKNTTFVLILRGAFTPTFPAAVKWGDGAAPTYSTPTIYTFTTVDAGTTYYGQSVAKAFS